MKKVHIATSRPEEIGNRCIKWAEQNTPERFELTEDMDECDIFISVLYDTIVPIKFISSYGQSRERRCCYNFHPGILPDYRGSGVYSWVLLNKEETTGVTLHEIDPDIDHGPIINFSRTSIYPDDTAETLFDRCMNILFYNLFVPNYHRLLSGEYTTWPNEGGKTYYRKDLEEAKDISHIIKAFTFEGKDTVYWIDSQGEKHYIEWE